MSPLNNCLLVLCGLFAVASSSITHEQIEKARQDAETDGGKIWALLVAGSAGWDNYRHQADVCHAYQVRGKSHHE